MFSPGNPFASKPTEHERVHRIAQQHGIDSEALADLIAEARSETRLRRRRLSDLRLMEHVAAIGGLIDRLGNGEIPALSKEVET